MDITNLDCAKFLVNNLDHSINFLRCDWSCSRLLTEQIHHMVSELIASLVIFFNLLLVN